MSNLPDPNIWKSDTAEDVEANVDRQSRGYTVKTSYSGSRFSDAIEELRQKLIAESSPSLADLVAPPAVKSSPTHKTGQRSTMTATTGDDIENALNIINQNGGLGQWETEMNEPLERYQFPRFHGATDDADQYLSRAGLGDNDTDVETVISWLEAPRNIVGGILLLGEPGCGKTALIEAAVTHMGTAKKPRHLVTHLCTPDDTRDSLFLRFVGEGKGDNGTPFVMGVIPRAAKMGAVLYLDEYMLLPDGVKPVTYQLMDGRRFLAGGNVDGTDLEIHKDFRIILSSNPGVRGASLPEPIGSRCASTTMTVETSASMLRDLGIDDSIVAAWEALGTAGLWRPQIREIRVADYWLPVDAGQAVSAFLPEHCPESERTEIRSQVASFIGGNHVRADGRLVVS